MTKCIIVFADWFSGRANFVIGHIMLLNVPFHKRENNGWERNITILAIRLSVSLSEETDENAEDEVP